MKTRGLRSVLVLIALTMVTGFVSPSMAGTRDAGGGSTPVAEFYAMARVFQDSLTPETADPIDLAELDRIVRDLQVEMVTDDLRLEDFTDVEAINYPSQVLVRFEKVAWIQKDLRQRYRLVIHELLGLLRLNDTDYKLSSHFAELTEEKALKELQKDPAAFVIRGEDPSRSFIVVGRKEFNSFKVGNIRFPEKPCKSFQRCAAEIVGYTFGINPINWDLMSVSIVREWGGDDLINSLTAVVHGHVNRIYIVSFNTHRAAGPGGSVKKGYWVTRYEVLEVAIGNPNSKYFLPH